MLWIWLYGAVVISIAFSLLWWIFKPNKIWRRLIFAVFFFAQRTYIPVATRVFSLLRCETASPSSYRYLMAAPYVACDGNAEYQQLRDVAWAMLFVLVLLLVLML